ncbi:MAG: hypothetical protein ACFWTJ_04910 [Lachnoclostridium sp.]
MLHILLAVLKIIGIILASLLGLLIFLILLVLLVPIRYGLKADNLNGLKAEGRISWLFRLIFIRISYLDEKLIIRLRLFGKLLYDSTNPKRKKVEQKKEVPKAKKSKALKKSAKSGSTKEKEKGKKIPKEDKTGSLHTNQSQIDGKTETVIIQPKEPELKAVQVPEHSEPISIGKTDKEKSSDENWNMPESVTDKAKRFFIAIKDFFLSLKERLINLWDRVQELRKNIENLKVKWEKIKAFFTDETNKTALIKSCHSVRKVLKHLRPTKFRLEMEFGTGDPASTGQVLGGLSILYSFVGDSVHIVPNFEEEILKGSVNCSGRIRLYTLLIIGIKLVFDKNFRDLLKNVKTLKEDL